MKILFTLLVLTVSLTLSAQQYRLPIGSNVDNHPTQVALGIGNWDTGWGVNGSFQYEPSMGNFEEVIKERLNALVASFNPPTGSEYDEYVLGIIANHGPYTSTHFKLQQSGTHWVIPQEVWKTGLELTYGNTRFDIKDVLVIKLDAEIASGATHYSTDDNTRYGDTPCFFGNQDDYRQDGIVYIQREYSVPSYQATIGLKSGQLTLRMTDGYAVEVSSPAPKSLEQFRITPVVSAPRISRIIRTGNVTEISVEGNVGTSVALEFSKNLREWQSDSGAWIKLSSSGQIILKHTSDALCEFYRLRFANEVQ